MKLQEITYKLRKGIGKGYDYEEVQATAEIEEGETPEEAMTALRKYVITSTTEYKTKQQKGASNE